MLTVNFGRVVEWPVDVDVPVDGGKFETQRFTAWFELLEQDAFDAIYKDGGNDADLLRRVVRRISDVKLEGGGEPTVEQLVGVTYIRVAMIRAYVECRTGARRKN